MEGEYMNRIAHITTWLFMAFSASSSIKWEKTELPKVEVPSAITQDAVKNKIFVTSPQLESLISGALKDSVEIYVMLGANDNPHTYKPTTEDLRHYREADVIILENRVAILESQEHSGKKFIICEDQSFLEDSKLHGINTDNNHVSYNIFAYQTALDILNNEVLTEEQKLKNKASLEEAQIGIDEFIELTSATAMIMAPSRDYSVLIAMEGIANPLAEHLYFNANSLNEQDEIRSCIIPVRISSIGRRKHSHGAVSERDLYKAILALQKKIESAHGHRPYKLIFLGDEESIAAAKRFTVKILGDQRSEEVTLGIFYYVSVPHNMDKDQFESYLDWLSDALGKLYEAV